MKNNLEQAIQPAPNTEAANTEAANPEAANPPNGVPEDLYRNPHFLQELSDEVIQAGLEAIRNRVESSNVLTRPDADQPDEKTEPKRSSATHGADMF